LARAFGDGRRSQCERFGFMIKGKKREESAVVCWRPDFRDRERLPDIKSVRTGFFVSALAITLAATMAIIVGIREYKIMNLRENIAEIQKEIDVYRVENAIIVNKNKEFRDHMLKIQEIVKFAEEKLVVSDLIMDVAQALPQGVLFKKFEYTEEEAKFEGMIPAEVNSDQALNQFIAGLKSIDSLKDRFKNFKQTSVARQSETGNVDFVVDINSMDAKDKRRKR